MAIRREVGLLLVFQHQSFLVWLIIILVNQLGVVETGRVRMEQFGGQDAGCPPVRQVKILLLGCDRLIRGAFRGLKVREDHQVTFRIFACCLLMSSLDNSR